MKEGERFLLNSMEDVFAPFTPDDIASSSREVIQRYLDRGAGNIGQITWVEFELGGRFVRGGIANAELMTCRIVTDPTEPTIERIVETVAFEAARPGNLIVFPEEAAHLWCVPGRARQPGAAPTDRLRAVLLTETLFYQVLELFNTDAALTQSEKRVVFQIVTGKSPGTAALLDGLSTETKRSQLKQAMAKLDCRSQSELVRHFTTQLIHLLYLCESESSDIDQTESFGARYFGTAGRLSVQRLSNGRVVRYWEFGPETGRPVLVTHGFLFPFLVISAEPELIRLGIRVVLPLRRGYLDNQPLSGLPEITQLIDDNLEDLILFTEMRWTEPVPILGHNTGAGYAIMAAVRRPDLYSELILASVNLLSRQESRTSTAARFIGGLRRLMEHVGVYEIAARQLQRMVLQNKHSAKAILHRMFKDSPHDDRVIRQLRQNDSTVIDWFRDVSLYSAIGLAADVNLLARPIDESIADLKVPTAFVHGTHDPYTSAEAISRYAAKVNRASTAFIDESGHYASASRPEAFWSAVAAGSGNAVSR